MVPETKEEEENLDPAGSLEKSRYVEDDATSQPKSHHRRSFPSESNEASLLAQKSSPHSRPPTGITGMICSTVNAISSPIIAEGENRGEDRENRCCQNYSSSHWVN